MKQDEAVEGVILMRVGEQAQVVLQARRGDDQGIERARAAAGREDRALLRPQELIEETTKTVEANLLRGMLLVLVILGLFLFSVRTALIVAVTIPFALMFSFICLDWRHIPANLLSIGAIDFGIIVDGVGGDGGKYFPRTGGALRAGVTSLLDVIRAAAHDVERPIFYAIAVIIAGYLPIYVLTGPFGPAVPADGGHHVVRAAGLAALRADGAAGALLVFPARQCTSRESASTSASATVTAACSAGACAIAWSRWCVVLAVFAASLLLIPLIGGEFMPHLDEGALWVRATTPYTISFEEASKLSPQIRNILLELSAGHDGGQRTGTSGRRHRSDRLFQQRILRRAEAVQRFAPGSGRSTTSRELIEAIQQKLSAFPGVIFNYTQPAEDAVDEAETGLKSALAVKIFGSDLQRWKTRPRR